MYLNVKLLIQRMFIDHNRQTNLTYRVAVFLKKLTPQMLLFLRKLMDHVLK